MILSNICLRVRMGVVRKAETNGVTWETSPLVPAERLLLPSCAASAVVTEPGLPCLGLSLSSLDGSRGGFIHRWHFQPSSVHARMGSVALSTKVTCLTSGVVSSKVIGVAEHICGVGISRSHSEMLYMSDSTCDSDLCGVKVKA